MTTLEYGDFAYLNLKIHLNGLIVMTSNSARSFVQESVRKASALQALAAEPGYHIWVSANAGSGKTTVLTSRIMRLLLADRGLLPRQIVGLTFTKAVAREMVVKLHKMVRGWERLEDAELAVKVAAITGADADAATLVRAREIPGLLRSDAPLITTLHGFGQMVLGRFPREAGLSAGFELIEGVKQQRLLNEALRTAIVGAAGMVADSLDSLLDVWGDEALSSMSHDLTQGETWNRLSLLLGDGEGVAKTRLRVCELLGLQGNGEPVVGWPLLDEEQALLGAWREALVSVPGATNDKVVGKIAAVLAGGGMEAWRGLFMKGTGEAFASSSLGTKPVQAALGGAWQEVLDLQRRVLLADDGARAARVYALTDALLVWGRFVKEIYEDLKRVRGQVDFGDMIGRLRGLLEGADGAWVHYRLDRSIRHLLLDEGQDNSPAQHAVFEILANELLGEAEEELMPDARRTVFAVGDMKQSIYRFQGAKPELFLKLRERLAVHGRMAFREVDLTHNFRSAPAVLQFVDKVFAEPLPAGVVRGDDRGWAGHATVYADGGSVEVWPLVEGEDEAGEYPEGWRTPGPKEVKALGAVKVGELIGAEVLRMVASGEVLGSTDEPVRLGDVMVLVQRNATAVQLAGVLGRMGVPAQVIGAGAGGVGLVEDVTAWLRVCMNGRDKVALATVLKSPLVGWDDARLVELHRVAGEDWWGGLRSVDSGVSAWLVESRERLLAEGSLDGLMWLAETRGLVGRYGCGDALRQAGAEASFAGLVEMAMAELEPTALVARLEREDVIPAAVAAGNAVRVMTVHKAKGLEAPVVFVAETTAAYNDLSKKREMFLWEEDEAGAPTAVMWWPGASADKPQGLLRLEQEELRRRRADSLRNLYVALTRAQDRLVICGWTGKVDAYKTDAEGVPVSWYGMVSAASATPLHVEFYGDGEVAG